MLPAVHRLRSPRDFSATTRHGVSATSRSVVAYLRVPSEAQVNEPARVGLVVSRAVGGSVVRHRVSRRLRSAVRPFLESLPAGSMMVLRALPAAGTDSDLGSATASAVERVIGRVRP
jgi:ribonuclease P protein component